jgi:uncharacterized protein YecE (DUF72 family)
MSIHIGTSGWSYKDWKKIFYPKGLESTDWISYYAILFRSTEINSSFYHLPKRPTVESWVNKVPPDFMFCPKMSRYLTHIKRLREPEESLDRFFEVFEPMKNNMGPVLIQLPPSLKFDFKTAQYLYQQFTNYKSYQFALEGRHDSWLTSESLDLMTRYEIAFVISQSGHGFPYAEHITAKNIYIRFHGPRELFASLYSIETMRHYAGLFKKWKEQGHVLWIFFNNDFHGYAITNALQLEELLKINT